MPYQTDSYGLFTPIMELVVTSSTRLEVQ